MSDPTTSRIDGYHAHIYYHAETRPVAERLAAAVTDRFAVEIGGFFDEPDGPHPRANLLIVFAPAEFATLVPWLMHNRDELDVLVHALSGDPARDHGSDALWLGTPLRLRPHTHRPSYRPDLLPSA